jgi:hypothetical protein
MTIIRVASDLHLEFFRSVPLDLLVAHFLPPDDRDHAAVLALAGDVSADPTQLLEFLRLVEQRFAAVVYVPGNHEYYGHDFHRWNGMARSWRLERTRIAADEIRMAYIAGSLFIYGTLWADGGATAQEQADVARGMMDFRQIAFGAGRFAVADMKTAHVRHRAGLANALKGTSGAVVITHHLPSYKLCQPRFGDRLNGGFASHCDALMEGETAPALWIHGHTHDTIETNIGRTRVVCNPAGYRPEWGTPFNDYFAAPKFYEVSTP